MKENKDNQKKKKYITGILYLSTFIIFVLLLYLQPLKVTLIQGNSMQPTLHPYEIHVFSKRKPVREDVVIFNSPKEWNLGNKLLIKRIIGIPGDIITIKENKIFVNGKERINYSGIFEYSEEVEIKLNNEYFVMGDNLGKSSDSFTQFISGTKSFLIKDEDINYSKSIKEVKHD